MAIVGLAIVAFIIGDLQKNRGAGQNEIAKIGKATFTYQDFDKRFNDAKENYTRQYGEQPSNDMEYQMRERLWEQLLQDTLYGMQFKKLGLMISEDEAESMMFEDGPYTSPYMRQQFTDPSTGQYNAQAAVRVFRDQFDELDQQQREEITNFRHGIERNRLEEKYNNLISKAFYVPTALAESEAQLAANRTDVVVACASYQNVSEENATTTDEDYKKYFNEHRAEIEKMLGLRMYEEIRKIEYIVYPIVPSPEDLTKISEEVDTIWKEFQAVEDANISEFVYGNSKPAQSYDTTYVKASEVKGLDSLIEKTAVGGFISPRQIGNEWVMAKVMKVENRPDSLRASTIYILNNKAGGNITRSNEQAKVLAFSVTEADAPCESVRASVVLVLNSNAQLESVTRTDDEAKLVADTVENLLKAKDANIEDIVAHYSDDPQKTSNKGDMGWVLDGTLYGFLNDDIVKTPEGGVFTYKRPDNLGYVVVKVTGKTTPKRKYRVAKVVREIAASNATSTQIYNKATWFVGQNRTEAEFTASAASENLSVREEMTTPMMNRLPGLENCRSIMQWTFDKKRKVGDVSEEVYSCGDMYVVVTLKEVYNKKSLTYDKVRDIIEQKVRLDKRAEYLMAQAGEAALATKDISALATKLNTTIDTLTNIGFRDNIRGGFDKFGKELKLQARVTVAKPNEVSSPIRGAEGVYFVKVINRQADENNNNAENLKAIMSREYGNKAYGAMQVLQNATKIKDNRNRFF